MKFWDFIVFVPLKHFVLLGVILASWLLLFHEPNPVLGVFADRSDLVKGGALVILGGAIVGWFTSLIKEIKKNAK